MKKRFIVIVFVAAALLVLAAMCILKPRNNISSEKILRGMPAKIITEFVNGKIAEITEFDMEDTRMQIVYQLARRSVVKIAVKNSAGSGIIWKVEEDKVVVAANRHLLMKDVKAEVTFCNGESAEAFIMGYSQQYDIGFLQIYTDGLSANVLRDIYEVVPAEYDTQDSASVEGFNNEHVDRPVLQIGADLDDSKKNVFAGNILEIGFEPVFNTNVLKTHCHSHAGMSGGGVFDVGGKLLGMLSGGDVAEDAVTKEAEISYSLPPSLILEEYELIINR